MKNEDKKPRSSERGAVTDLITRLENAEIKPGSDRLALADELAMHVFGKKATLNEADLFLKALQGSLDAALALVGEVLPGWGKDKRLMIECDPHRGPFWQVRIKSSGDDWPAHGEKHKSPAIALLIALLKAHALLKAKD